MTGEEYLRRQQTACGQSLSGNDQQKRGKENMEQNLNLYHIFYTVAKYRNISGAARALYISQPAISKAISRLEQNLDTTLFLRSSRGVRLTEEGELLYRQVESAFASLQQGEEQLRRVRELGIGRLSIGASSTLCKYVLLPYLGRFTPENPHIQISISCQSTYHTMEALEKGMVDVGLIGENERMDKLDFYPTQVVEDILVCTQRYLNNLRRRAGLAHNASAARILNASTLMLLNKENITRQYIERYLAQEQITPEQTLEVTSMDLLIDFARIDLGIACVIQSFVQKELDRGELIRLPLPVSIPPRRVGFACMKNLPLPSCAQRFLEFCGVKE